MNRGKIIKRHWSKKSQISEHTELLDIWDTGSHIYERWPDSTEFYWKVISRELTDTGFTEVLEQMPPWEAPGQVLRREQIPLLQVSLYHYQLGEWSVGQDVCDEGDMIKDLHMSLQDPHNKPSLKEKQKQGQRPQMQRPQGQRPQMQRPQMHQSQIRRPQRQRIQGQRALDPPIIS
jgi:hypothetical protein